MLPVALLDALSLLALVVVLAIVIRLYARPGAHTTCDQLSLHWAAPRGGSCCLSGALGSWGFNYRRVPEQRLSVVPESPTREAVMKLGMTAQRD